MHTDKSNLVMLNGPGKDAKPRFSLCSSVLSVVKAVDFHPWKSA
jgi:hypothetical protein